MIATTAGLKILVDRTKKSKRQISYDIYSGHALLATVRDKWHIDGDRYVHDWSCDCGQPECRHIIQAKGKAFEKKMPAPMVEPVEEQPARRPFKPFLE